MSHSMKFYLDHLLNKSENGEAAVMIQFRSMGAPVQGALRRVVDVEGVSDMYELLSIAQNSPHGGKPFGVSNFFTADEVARVMVLTDEDKLPRIIAPPSSGLVVPS